MRWAPLLTGATLAFSSVWAIAQDAPESLLPPGFDRPAPSPSPAAPRPAPAPAPAPAATPAPAPRSSASPVVQALPEGRATQVEGGSSAATQEPEFLAKLPSLEELERMTPEEFEDLLGIKPQFDIPPSARRSTRQIGVIGASEGGFAPEALVTQPASLIRAILASNRGMLVSRWGHILLRRALASRLDSPRGMNPANFAALRAKLLLRMGEADAARWIVQDIDTGLYTAALTNAALEAYIATGDLTGVCPAMATRGGLRDDPQWETAQAICMAFRGNGNEALRRMDRGIARQTMPRVDLLLAQKYAGAAGNTRRAVTIEWDEVEALTPWRFGLATAVGLEPPERLLDGAGPYYAAVTSLSPAVGLVRRAAAADRAAGRGILSSTAMIDLYGQLYSEPDIEGEAAARAEALREAYVAASGEARLAAIQGLWNGAPGELERYSRHVLTAYAAARLPVSAEMESQAGGLIASMLTAGLDRNALRWAEVVPAGSEAWGLLALAAPNRASPVSGSDLDNYINDDESADMRKSAFLVAGLAGLGRIDEGEAAGFAGQLGISLRHESRWARAITAAAAQNNRPLVAMLAGLGMQGDSWSDMTPRHLYTIISALRRVGLDAEARMIAAEAVARA